MTTNLYRPELAAVGVPEITPVEEFRVIPLGRAGVTLQAFAPDPPVAERVVEYAIPFCAIGKDVVVMLTV